MRRSQTLALLLILGVEAWLRADPPPVVIDVPQFDPRPTATPVLQPAPDFALPGYPPQAIVAPSQFIAPPQPFSNPVPPMYQAQAPVAPAIYQAPAPAPVPYVEPQAATPPVDFTDPGPRFHLLGGAGLNLLVPFLNNNRAFTTFAPTAGGGQSIQSTDFGNPLIVAPRFWVGVVGNSGWGFRTSYWELRDKISQSGTLNGSAAAGSTIVSASPLGLGIMTGTSLLAPGNADVLAAESSMNLSVLDFELTRELALGSAFLVFSGGGRYARLSDHYAVDVFNTANNFSTTAQIDYLRSAQRFTGGGPTMCLQGWYPVWRSRLSLFASARGSILFGASAQSATVSEFKVVGGGVPSDTLLSDLSANRLNVVPVAELEAGVQWTGTWGRFRPFLRTGVVAQTWFNAVTTSSATTPLGDTTSINSNLSFLGASFLAGVNY